MKTTRILFALTLATTLHSAADPAIDASLVRATEPLTPEEQRKHFKLPDGFDIQLFAAEPMIHKPINLAIDEKSRVWVTSNHEYPYPAARDRWADPEGTRVRDSKDAIFILEDTDGDGLADKRTVFADGLNIPTGILPYKTGCIAWSIPNIWFFDDTNGDGVCDTRTILFGPLGWERDVHGNCSSFRLAPDGWVYATHGFSNTSHFKVRPENLGTAKPGDPGTEMKVHSGNVFRFKPDGSRVELFSAGQVNPFGLAWDRHGNLYSADCHSAPIYQLLRGATYPSFGKPDDGIGFGPVMMHHTHSSTGICGITYLEAPIWGEAWHDRILIGNVVTSRINTDRVTFRGSTPVAHEEPDFLSSTDPWFRPVDLRIGPDRALYVADFYNRIIGHYEVPLDHPGRDRERGRIWKITKKDLPPATPPAADRIATLRFAARSGPPSEADQQTLREWLKSGDPFEKRAAAEALFRPLSVDWLPDLLSAWSNTPDEDLSLHHQLRIVIREHLRLPGAFTKLGATPHPEIATLARSVDSPEASRFLLDQLAKQTGDLPELLKSITSLATRLPAETLADFSRHHFSGNPTAQADLLAAIEDGVRQRGELPGTALLDWGNTIAATLLDRAYPEDATRLQKLAQLLKFAAPAGLRDRLATHLPPAPPLPPTEQTPERRAELDRLIQQRSTAFTTASIDKLRGEIVYQEQCAACHAIGGKGAIVGPQLDGIGNRGVARIFEDILDPGRNVDSHFRLHVIKRKDGSTFAGLERGQIGELIICVDATGKEHRIPKRDIESNTETGLSLMPAAFANSISEADLHHLVGWLLESR
jgi:putative heme-binding domain-containing protein